MRRYIAQANIDHYIGALTDGCLTSADRGIVTKLLIDELDKLGHDQEHLEFAESRAAIGRDLVLHARSMRDSLPPGSPEREEAERPLINAENLLTLLQDFCHRLREKANLGVSRAG